MAASQTTYHDVIYFNELAVDRSASRGFRQNGPWASSPIVSAVVFIALSTIVVFYMQARSLTRKMRPTASGVPARLPATVVWGLFSLQYSQLSHVQAENVQQHGLVGLGCSSNQEFGGLQSISAAGFGAILNIQGEFVSHNAGTVRLSGVPHFVSRMNESQTAEQRRVSNEVKTLGNPAAREGSPVPQTADFGFAQDYKSADSDRSVRSLLNARRILWTCDCTTRKEVSNASFPSTCLGGPSTETQIKSQKALFAHQ